MLAKGTAAASALSRPDPAIRLFVLGGEDESGSRAMQASLGRAMGDDATRVDLTAAQLKDDPALLVDEAAAMSLFGGRRWIAVSVPSGGGDEIVAACGNLLAAPAAGNPVVVVGAAISARSKLYKLAEKHGSALAVISYAPDAKAAGGLVEAVAAPLGLTLGKGVARAIVAATGADRGLIAQEVEKLALYVDALPTAPRIAELADWTAIGADLIEDSTSDAIDVVMGGRLAALPALLSTLDASGTSAIPLLRAMVRRAVQLADLRAGVEAGRSVGQVVDGAKAIFWKDKAAITAQLTRWDSARLAKLVDRLIDLERRLKAPDNPGQLLLRAGLLDIARVAASNGTRAYS